MPDYNIRANHNTSNKLMMSKTFNAATLAAAFILAAADVDFIAATAPGGIGTGATQSTLFATESITTVGTIALGQATEVTLAAIASDTAKLTDDSMNVSNQSVAPLGVSATFTGVYENLDGYAGVIIVAFSNVTSAASGVKLDWSSDGINIDFVESFTTASNNSNFAFAQFLPRRAQYVRPRYINGGTGQTTFRFGFRRVNQADVPSITSASQTVNIDQTTPGTTNAVAQQGTWNITNISGVVSLPTGAATLANQTTTNSTLTTIDAKLATAKTFDFDTGAGTDTVQALGIALPASGGAVAGGTSTNPIRTDPTNTTVTAIGDSSGQSIAFGNEHRLKVGVETQLIFDPVKANALNTNIWLSSVSTMTITQAPGMLTLNAGLSTAANAYAILSSIKRPLQTLFFPLMYHTRAQIKPQSNSVIEFGFGTVATNVAPTDGFFFRWDSAGLLKGVINNAGTEALTSTITALDPTKYYDFEIMVTQSYAQFKISLASGTIVTDTRLTLPDTMASGSSAGTLSAFERVYNTAIAPSTAPQAIFAIVCINQMDLVNNKSWELQRTQNAKGAYQETLSPFTQTANATNSTAPASATLSNTAAGYTTLGGLYQFAGALGAETDYCLFGYQVPGGLQLIIEGIVITCVLTGADIGATATVLQWGIGLNSSAVSLATAEAPPATYAPRRIPLGMMGFLDTDVIGKQPADIIRAFHAPLVVDAGRFLQVILRIPVGLLTALQVFRGTITINGYFE